LSHHFKSKIKIMSNNILILGGTGKTGKRVAERLAKLNMPIRIGSRNAQPAFDWDKPETWPGALAGMQTVYISFQPDLAVPGGVEAIEALIKASIKAGVQKLVLLSGRGEEEAQQCENIVIASGLDWVVLRSSWFNQNFSEGSFLDQVAAGYIALPVGNVGEPFIDTDDIADIAVIALTEDTYNGQILELTGSRLLTFKEVTDEIATITGRAIHFEQIPIEEYTATLKEYEVPDQYISLLTYLFTSVLDGRNESLTGDAQRVLGRAPIDFSDYAKKVAATGIWNPQN
jgi:uncharacterized protein YbjT (DUF2867 family)